MKKLMNLVKDSALVMLVANSVVGSPNKSYDSRFLYEDILSEDAFKPKVSIFVEKENHKEMNYSKLLEAIQRAHSKIKVPDYISISVQMARSYVESSNNPKATSPVGARGLMQIMKSSWYDVMNVSFDKAYDPLLNIEASLRHIKKVDMFLRQNYIGPDGHTRFDQLPVNHKRDLLNAAYNGGQGRLMRTGWNISLMPKETRDYVSRMRDRTLLEDMRIYETYQRQNNIVRLEVPEYNR